jgi:hypothetical protein
MLKPSPGFPNPPTKRRRFLRTSFWIVAALTVCFFVFYVALLFGGQQAPG